MQDQDDEEIEMLDSELFDISGIDFDLKRTKSGCNLYFILKSDRPINLMQFYLWTKQYIESLERDLGVLEESPETH